MRLMSVALLAASLSLAACDNAERVERPYADVYATLASMPAEADVMDLATTFPGTDSWLENRPGQLTWHFTHEGKDYGRFLVTLAEDGASATKVSTSFEEANDAAASARLGFLRQMARKAGEASVAAALTGRPADRTALQQEMTQLIMSDPMAAQVAVIETVGSEMDRLAPEDPCDSDDRVRRERCETFERNRGRSGGLQEAR